MTVQRQYTLPNCNLKLEGLSAGDENDPTAPLTVVLNSECTFPGIAETLSGGRDFLNALVKTVSDYSQSLLSGVPYPLVETPSDAHPIALKLGDNQRHELVAQTADMNGQATEKRVQLNTIQLFDLMEAVDQLLADALTLPDMTLQLAPLDRRHARPAEPASKRVIPIATGLSALAASAALLFFVPVPEFEPSTRESEGASLSELVEEESANLSDAASAPPDELDNAEDDAIATEDTDAAGDVDAIAETTEVDPVAAGIALGRLAAAPVITDEAVLDELGANLENSLAAALDEDAEFDTELVYRVAVSAAGDVLGYKYENDAALTEVDNTPLPEVTFIPVEGATTSDEPVAQFRVTFAEDGDVTAEVISEADIEAE